MAELEVASVAEDDKEPVKLPVVIRSAHFDPVDIVEGPGQLRQYNQSASLNLDGSVHSVESSPDQPRPCNLVEQKRNGGKKKKGEPKR